MARFFTSDLHLGHQNIISFCDRPYSTVDNMNHDLVDRWNAIVGRHDEVIVVGDLAMGKLDESLAFVRRFNGTKKLIPGNHDRMFGCEGTKYRNTCDWYLQAGFAEILDDQINVDIAGTTYLVCHFPYKGESKEGHEDRYQEKRPKDEGMRLIHGHIHGHWRKTGHMVDVGVDAWGGRPVSEDELDQAFSSSESVLTPLPW